MDLSGLAGRMRDEFLDDTTGSDAERRWPLQNLYSALISAEKEIASRLLLISDSTTPSICQITVTMVNGAYPRTYAISDRILRIERLRFPNVLKPLSQKTVAQLDREDSGWDDATGVPAAYTVDYNTAQLTFNRVPTSGGIATMSVKRRPVTERIAADRRGDSSLEIKSYDEPIIHGALKYAYLKNDSQTFDPVRSKVWAGVFETDIKQIQQDMAAFNPQTLVMQPEAF